MWSLRKGGKLVNEENAKKASCPAAFLEAITSSGARICWKNCLAAKAEDITYWTSLAKKNIKNL
jgi:hypothetical protein